MQPQSLVFGALALLFATLAGCSSSTDVETDTDEGETRILPSGTDSPGKLNVTLPSGPAEPTTFRWKDTKQSAGQAIGPVPVGLQNFSVRSGSIEVQGVANIEAGKTTTVQAALLALDAVSGPRTLGLVSDPTSSAISLISLGQTRAPNGLVSPTSNGASGLALLAGKYEVRFGVNGRDGVAVEVAAGGTAKVLLTDASQRRVTRIVAPVREMPTDDCEGRVVADADSSYRISVGSTYSDAKMPSSAQLDVGEGPGIVYSEYAFRAPAWREAQTLPLPAKGQVLTFALGRVDIDDVLINATQPRVKGTYQIYREGGAGNGPALLKCAPKTGTGVDLAPGKYRIEVKYKTVEAGDKIDVIPFTVP